MVAISDMFEVESSKLALEKKVAADQAFAQRMVHDHTQTTEQLKHLVGGGKVKAQLPAELDRRAQTNARKATRRIGRRFQ
jgi:putative membrane protein